MRKDPEWLPNVSDIEAIRSLRQVEAPIAAPCSPSEKVTTTKSSAGTRVNNPLRDGRFKLDNGFYKAVKEKAERKIIGTAKAAGTTLPMTADGKERYTTRQYLLVGLCNSGTEGRAFTNL